MDVRAASSVLCLIGAAGCALAIPVGPSLGGLRREPLDLGTPRYYDAPFGEVTRHLQAAMASVLTAPARLNDEPVGSLDKPTTHDSVWILTGDYDEFTGTPIHVPLAEDSAMLARGFRQRFGALIRAVARDEGSQGIAVRIVARMDYCTGHDGWIKCTTADTEAYPPVLEIWAGLDDRGGLGWYRCPQSGCRGWRRPIDQPSHPQESP